MVRRPAARSERAARLSARRRTDQGVLGDRSKTVHFRQVHLAAGARIEHRRVCRGEGGPRRRDRRGPRALQRRVRRADQGRDRGRRRRAREADRRRALRRGRGHRPRLLRHDLLPRRGRRRRGRLPAAGLGARQVRQVALVALGLPRPRRLVAVCTLDARPRLCTRCFPDDVVDATTSISGPAAQPVRPRVDRLPLVDGLYAGLRRERLRG